MCQDLAQEMLASLNLLNTLAFLRQFDTLTPSPRVIGALDYVTLTTILGDPSCPLGQNVIAKENGTTLR